MRNFIFLLLLFTSIHAQYEWSDPVMIAPKVTFPEASYGSPTITVDNNGVIHAFWRTAFNRFGDDYEQIMYKSSQDGGVNWSETENLTPQYTEKRQLIGNMNIVCDTGNNLHLFFLRGSEWSKVMYMKYDGISWSTPESIYDYVISMLEVEIDNNDRIYATWYSSPALYTFYDGISWQEPMEVSTEHSVSIYDFIIDKNNDIYASGIIEVDSAYKPILCRYNSTKNEWTDFYQIPGFKGLSIACALTMSKNDTINVNVGVGPTDTENTNYNLKFCPNDSTWTIPQYVNENTYMRAKDFYRDNDDNLHLFEESTDDLSITHTTFFKDDFNEYIFPCELENSLQVPKIYFDKRDMFYAIYRKNYHDTNERAVFFHKKQIEVGIEESDELIEMSYVLEQNYPNPFNNQTNIKYTLQNKSGVEINVFNLQGQFVQNLVNTVVNTGIHSATFKADNLNSGIYYYQLKINGVIQDTKKMLYLR